MAERYYQFGHPGAYDVDTWDQTCYGSPPCGGCSTCLLAQAAYAGVEFYPIVGLDGTFWHCRSCGYHETLDQAAARFAAWWHHEQKYGDRPYIAHCRAVVDVLCEFDWTDPTTLAAGWLHDVVEDTDATIEWVRKSFGPGVANLVEPLTDGPGTRKERKAAMLERLRDAPLKARAVKSADRLANVRACVASYGQRQRLDMYRQEHAAFRALVPDLRINAELDKLLDINR